MTIDQYTDQAWQVATAALATLCAVTLIVIVGFIVVKAVEALWDYVS